MIGNIRKSLGSCYCRPSAAHCSSSLGQCSDAQTPKTGKLTIKITGIRNAEGNIRVALSAPTKTRSSIPKLSRLIRRPSPPKPYSTTWQKEPTVSQ